MYLEDNDEAAEKRLLDQKQVLSPLMRAKKGATKGQKVNACPFGCSVRDLDEQGYCRHLVGFTTDGKLMEPMVRRGGRRVVEVKRDKIMLGEVDPVDHTEAFEWGEPILEPVLKTDQLVRITVSSRVYRDVDKAKDAEPKKGKALVSA